MDVLYYLAIGVVFVLGFVFALVVLGIGVMASFGYIIAYALGYVIVGPDAAHMIGIGGALAMAGVAICTILDDRGGIAFVDIDG